MTEGNSTKDYNEFVRVNLPSGMTYNGEVDRYQINNHSFFKFKQADWYYKYIIKYGFSAGFDPLTLFAAGEQGVWYDPSQAANLDWRRNLLTFTEQFDNAVWVKTNATVTPNSAVAPDGSVTADKLTAPAAGADCAVLQAVSATVNSVYVKRINNDWVALSNNSFFAYFDISAGATGIIGSGTSSITDAGNGWWRIVWVPESGAGAIRIRNARANGDKQVNGGEECLIWGAQLEVGSTATEYQRISDVNTEVRERFPNTTTFTDTAGTTPATVGDAVALMLDKSKGLVLGPELVTNGTFDTDLTGWTNGNNHWQIVSGAAYHPSSSTFNGLSWPVSLTAGQIYVVSFDITSIASGTLRLTGITDLSYTTSGTKTFRFVATGSETSLVFGRFFGTTLECTIDNISVKELPGYHATQGTTAARPILARVPARGRVNLLTRTEEFDNAAWVKSEVTVSTNAATAPNGVTAAEKVTESSNNQQHIIYQQITLASAAHSHSVYLKASERNLAYVWIQKGTRLGAVFNLSDGTISSTEVGITATITAAGDDWHLCSVTRASVDAGTCFAGVSLIASGTEQTYTGDGTSGIFIWGAQLEQSSTASAYQKVTSTYDVTEAGQADNYFLWFDGIDDSMVTPTITPGIDKVQVFAGVRVFSDAVGIILEHSVNTVQNAGAFVAYRQQTAGYGLNTRGSASAVVINTSSGYAAPVSNVYTGISDISGDLAAFRIDGTQIAQSTADQGTGNFLAYPMYIGRRGGTSNPLNGHLHQLITRFGANLDANTITQTEKYVSTKTAGVDLT